MIGASVGVESLLPLKKPKLLQHLFYEQRQLLLALDVEAGETAGVSDSFACKSSCLLEFIRVIQAEALSSNALTDAGVILRGLQSWLRAMHFLEDTVPQLRGAARVAFVAERIRQAEICVASKLFKDSKFAAILSDYFNDLGVRSQALLELGAVLEVEQGLSVLRTVYSAMSTASQSALLEELLGDQKFISVLPNAIFELAAAWSEKVCAHGGKDGSLPVALRLLAKIADSLLHDQRFLGIVLNVVAGNLKLLFETQQAFDVFIELIVPQIFRDRDRACDFACPIISRMRGVAKRFDLDRLDVAFGNVCAFTEVLQKRIPDAVGVAHFTDELVQCRLFTDEVLLRHQVKVTRLLAEQIRARGLPFGDELLRNWVARLNATEKMLLVETLIQCLEGSTCWDWHTLFERAFWEGRVEGDRLVPLACAISAWYLPHRDGAAAKLNTENTGNTHNWADLSKLAKCIHDHVYPSAAQSARSLLQERHPLEADAMEQATRLAQLALFVLSYYPSFQIIALMRDFGSSALQKAVTVQHRYFLCQLYGQLLYGFQCEEKLLERLGRVLDPRNQPLFWLQTLIGDAQEYGQCLFLSRAMGLDAVDRLACIKALQIPLKVTFDTLSQCKQSFASCSPETWRRHCCFLVHLALHYESPDMARAVLSIKGADFEVLSCFKLIRLFCSAGHALPREVFRMLCQPQNLLPFLNCLRSDSHFLCADELMALADGILNEALGNLEDDMMHGLAHGLAMASVLARLEHVPGWRRALSLLAIWEGFKEAGAGAELVACTLLLEVFYRNLRPKDACLITEAQADLLSTVLSRLASECGYACDFRLSLMSVARSDLFNAQYDGRAAVDALDLRDALDFKVSIPLDRPERGAVLLRMLDFLKLFRGQLQNWSGFEVVELEIRKHLGWKG